MIPYPFDYRRAGSLAEAAALLKGDARILAGGQSLIPAMKTRLAAPAMLIDISRLPELDFIRREKHRLCIGANVSHDRVATAPETTAVICALAQLAGGIGDPAVRYRGTLGGSIAHNDPAADYPAAALALDAAIVTQKRRIAAGDFFTGMFSTALEEDEIIAELRFAIPRRAAYSKFRSQASRYAIAGVFVAQGDTGVRVAVTGAGPCVFRLPDMEQALEKNFHPAALAGIRVDAGLLNSDLHASADYRAHLIGVMAQRAVEAALAGAIPA